MQKLAVLQGSSRLLLPISLLVLACSSPPPAQQAEPVTKAAEKPSAEAEAPERADLPAELSPADLKEVVEPAKVDIRHTCKGVARSRERVEVKLTIADASGQCHTPACGTTGATRSWRSAWPANWRG